MVTDTLTRGKISHTPGPWRQETGTNLVWGACNPDDTTSYGMGIPVAEARVVLDHTYDWEQACANARLIASAPDLLWLVKANISTLEAQRERCIRWNKSHAEIDAALKESRAALAKVTAA